MHIHSLHITNSYRQEKEGGWALSYIQPERYHVKYR